MNNYGKSAIRSVELLHLNRVQYTDEAWEIAIVETFIDISSRTTKACPRSAFLGLCEGGLVKGITDEQIKKNLRNSTNKDHAIDAVDILRSKSSTATYSPLELWREIMKGNGKSHNFQMDVVLALWNNGLIIPRSTAAFQIRRKQFHT